MYKLSSSSTKTSKTFLSNVHKNRFKETKKQKQKERKEIVTKEIRSFFGGSTIVKSSNPLN